MAKFKPLTPEQAEHFRARWLDPGVTIGKICQEFHITRATVYYWVSRRFKLPKRPRSHWDFAPRRPVFEVRDTEPAGAYDNLPAARLHGLPARPRPGDRPGERWIQLR